MAAKVSDNVREREGGIGEARRRSEEIRPGDDAPTANGAAELRPPRVTPKTTSTRLKAAMTSPSPGPGLLRTWVDRLTAGNENMRFVRTTSAGAHELSRDVAGQFSQMQTADQYVGAADHRIEMCAGH
jgi:hypothetical protein